MNLHPYQLPLKNGTFREGILIQQENCWGDICPLPGFSKESLAQAKEEALQVLERGIAPKLPSVQFAFACLQTPLPNSIRVNVAALERVEIGFRAIKRKVGHLELEETIALVKQMPKQIPLRLDFNRKWPLAKLLQFARFFSPNDFDYLEEPTDNFADLLTFSKETQMPIAVDESISDVPYWEIPTLKAVVVKPTILGQIPFVPPQAELIFSSAYESGIGLLHIAALCQQHAPHLCHGLDSYSQLLSDVIHPRPLIQNGLLTWQKR